MSGLENENGVQNIKNEKYGKVSHIQDRRNYCSGGKSGEQKGDGHPSDPGLADSFYHCTRWFILENSW
jgi:hypothetical protein